MEFKPKSYAVYFNNNYIGFVAKSYAELPDESTIITYFSNLLLYKNHGTLAEIERALPFELYQPEIYYVKEKEVEKYKVSILSFHKNQPFTKKGAEKDLIEVYEILSKTDLIGKLVIKN